MTLNSSGPISLGGSTAGQSVNLELGQSATAQISFNDAAVRTLTGTTSGTALVMPTNFYGKSSVVISITDQTISDLDASDANAYYFLTAGGQVQQSTDIGGINPTTLEQWCTPTSQASNYEAYVTVTSGSLTPGSAATGTWVALSSTRYWYVQESVSGQSTTCIFTVQIRRIGTTTVLDTATITLEAQVL